MAAFSAFYPYIAPYLRNVSEPMMDQAIRQTARDIASRTHCEVVTQRMNVAAGTVDYTLAPGTGRESVRLLKVFYLTQELTLDSPFDITDPLALVGDIATAEAVDNAPCEAFGDNPLTKVTVYPVPAIPVTLGLTIRFTVRPTLTATTVPDILLQYEHVVAAGVISRLQAMPNQPWSDAVSAGGSKMAYELGLASMRAEILRGNALSKRRVRPVRFM